MKETGSRRSALPIAVSVCWALLGVAGSFAQTPSPSAPTPSVASPPPSAAGQAVPSLDSLKTADASNPGLARAQRQEKLDLPNSSGQYWVEYDIRPYTQNLKTVDRPQQAIIDWIVRETGSDVWFHEPVGILTADRSTLRVYHTAGMHQVVAQVYERFVNASHEPQVFSLRMISIANPNWRSKALPLMRSAEAKTPGLQAWLMTKENAAIFGAQLRQRQDAREIQAADITMIHGQTQTLEQLRSRNYLKEYVPNAMTPWPPLTPKYENIQEGYRMVFSPLLSLDGRSMDVMLKCDIDQVERFLSVPIDAPTAGANLQVQVPQLVSWRLQERFRWPTDQVLVLSCGVVAAPTGTPQNTLLGGGAPSFLGVDRLIPANMAGQRNDALLIIEYKGSGSNQLIPASANARSAAVMNGANGNPSSVSRGRY